MNANQKSIVAAIYLLASVASVARAQPANDRFSLIDAVKHADEIAVDALLKRGVDVNRQSPDGATALAWAAMRANLRISRQLVSAGANPNIVNVIGVGPLSLAIENGATELARFLLASGADPNFARETGETALMTAARTEQTEIARLLLERGADVNASEKKFGQTALMWASPYPDLVTLLIAHGADLHTRTKTWDVTATIFVPGTYTLGITGIPWLFDGEYTSPKGGHTPLFFAVQSRSLESARALIEAGSDVNATASDGTTPLLTALYKWDRSTPVARKGLPGLGDFYSSSPVFAPDIAMANLLLDKGAHPNAADGAGYTPLHGAVLAVVSSARGDRGIAASAPVAPLTETIALVRRLLEVGADPKRQTMYPTSGPLGAVRLNPAPPGSSPFHVAATSRNVELVRLLAARGANPNLVRKDGHTPFSLAVKANDVAVARELVAAGADLTMRYSPADLLPDPVESKALRRAGQSILHIAAAARAHLSVEYLASLNAPLDLENEMGETPLKLADDQERFEVALAKEGGGGPRDVGRDIPRDSKTSDLIKRLLAERMRVTSQQ